MDAESVCNLIRKVLQWDPQSAQHMTFGHSNTVWDVSCTEGGVIARFNTNPGVLTGTERNLAILRELGLPVPEVLAVDLSLAEFPEAFILLKKIPGADLRDELPHMTHGQMEVLADQIVRIQRLVGTLPLGTGFGWVPVGATGPFQTWTDIIQRDLRSGLQQVAGALTGGVIARIQALIDEFTPYFETVLPSCFLDDITIKNVILQAGVLQGLVDFDWVCYGDPLYMVGLTKTAVISDVGTHGLYYVERLCQSWELSDHQRQVVDVYALIHAMRFYGFHIRHGDHAAAQGMLRMVQDTVGRW